MPTVLVTGSSRGLGLEFCRQYAQEGWRVIATCRNPAFADGLGCLARQFPQLQVEALDVADFGQVDALAKKLADEKIDLLLNNAGVYGDDPGHGFGQLDYSAWAATLKVNVFAPTKMLEAFLPQLESGEKKLAVSVSSLMGSITDNSSGGSVIYRSSKAALNAAMKSLAISLRPRSVGVLVLHPGWVKTAMGGGDAPLSPEESVTGMRQVIAKFTLEQSGGFFKFDGSELPW